MQKKIIWEGVAGILLLPTLLLAQPVGSATAQLVWDQPAPSLADAQGYLYKYYPDDTPTGSDLSGVKCAETPDPALFVCRAAFPAFTPAAHTISVTAGNEAGDSLPSNVLQFVFVVLPQAPQGLRIERP